MVKRFTSDREARNKKDGRLLSAISSKIRYKEEREFSLCHETESYSFLLVKSNK